MNKMICKWILVFIIATLVMWAIILGTSQEIILPNNMIVRRAHSWNMDKSNSLLAADGKAVLAKQVELFCFNDRYVYVLSRDKEYSGLYDANTGGALGGISHSESMAVSGLQSSGGGCNGYYTGWIDPRFLFENSQPPFLPPCEWKNTGNLKLKNRSWFERPCISG